MKSQNSPNELDSGSRYTIKVARVNLNQTDKRINLTFLLSIGYKEQIELPVNCDAEIR